MQYRKGSFTSASTAAAVTVDLGFQPDKFILVNYTGYNTDGVISESVYYSGMPSGYAMTKTVRADTDLAFNYQSPAVLTSGGFTLFQVGADWPATQYTITGITQANPGVLSVSSAAGLTEGATVTASGVRGMVQLNANRYIVTNLAGNSFELYDLFGNPVNTAVMGAYISGGIINVISTDSTPPGLQFDEGAQGIILGASLFRNSADVFYWEAFAETPTGY